MKMRRGADERDRVAGLNLVVGFLPLILCQLGGEVMRAALHLPLPGPVVGMFLLAAILVARQGSDESAPGSVHGIETVSNGLIANMGLLFVPAGVGIVSVLPSVAGSWEAMIGALVVSTVLSLLTTAATMHWWLRRRAARLEGTIT